MAVSRRSFLLGSGGAALALPILSSLTSRGAAQGSQMRRLVVMMHQGGLVRTKWMPGSTGALPATGDISEILAPLSSIRDQVVVLSGLGNPARHIVPGDNHRRTNTTVLTNATPQDDVLAGGPSVDQLAAQLIGSETQRSSVLLPLSPAWDGPSYFFSQSSGGLVSAVTPFSSNPREAAMTLFASLPGVGGPPAQPTYAERLRMRRSTLLGAATGNLRSLRARVSQSDRARLDAHEEHLTRLSTRFAAPATPPSIECVAPDYGTIPNYPDPDELGRYDSETAPAQIDNLIRAFSCDITRVGTLFFNNGQSPTFPWLYGGDTGAAWTGQDGRQYTDWHDMIHNGQPTGADSDSGVPNLVRGHTWYAQQFAYLVQQLASTPEIDGNGMMLDNTLVLWMSDFGHENHGTHNIPAILAGLGSAFPKGRYLDVDGHTIGDLHATVLHLLGAPDTVTVGEDTPINWGALDELWAYSGSESRRPSRFNNGLLPI